MFFCASLSDKNRVFQTFNENVIWDIFSKYTADYVLRFERNSLILVISVERRFEQSLGVDRGQTVFHSIVVHRVARPRASGSLLFPHKIVRLVGEFI